MRKIRVLVNRILIFVGVGLLYLTGTSGAFAGDRAYRMYPVGTAHDVHLRADRGHIIAESESAGFNIVSRAGSKMLAPVGSLLKPFAALYLLEHGVNHAQEIYCPPIRKQSVMLRCWTPAGHGAMNIATALVQSCNYYFLSQFRGRDLNSYEAWLRQRYSWPENLHITKPVHVYGYDLEFGIEASVLLQMYTRLLQEAASGAEHAVTVSGALKNICLGTLAEFCARLAKQPQYHLVLGKTGTVKEGERNFGAVVLLIDHVPRGKKLLLICYEKDKTGSQAAMHALKLLSEYEHKKRN